MVKNAAASEEDLKKTFQCPFSGREKKGCRSITSFGMSKALIFCSDDSGPFQISPVFFGKWSHEHIGGTGNGERGLGSLYGLSRSNALNNLVQGCSFLYAWLVTANFCCPATSIRYMNLFGPKTLVLSNRRS